MRGLVDRERLGRLMSAMGRAARATAVVYFTGGVSAVRYPAIDPTSFRAAVEDSHPG